MPLKGGVIVPTELIKQLLEAGVHFGHKTSRWNPKMKKFIFGSRSGVYIIDLEKTEECLNKARDFVVDLTSKGDYVLFVGTKKQAQAVVHEEALRSGMFYVTQRWPGGLLTNFSTVKSSINRLREIEKMKEDGTYEKFTKKEVAGLEKELEKLRKNFSGITQMEKMPKAIFIVDTKKEETAVREALKLGIPIIGLLDTNCNPDPVAFPVPGNDDAAKSIKLITNLIAESAVEGRKRFLSYLSETGVNKIKDEPVQEAQVISAEEETTIKVIEEVVETDQALPKKNIKTRAK
ncbi:MAG: 30S ribosomal protein S2 [Candidatus Omnitrophica bacterium]|jgi:small subunit ribosomal protein S2|nr:30S ribosomal protein S2 [Candidatus Omnitrophota bacterium]